jgi:hypothetical protein
MLSLVARVPSHGQESRRRLVCQRQRIRCKSPVDRVAVAFPLLSLEVWQTYGRQQNHLVVRELSDGRQSLRRLEAKCPVLWAIYSHLRPFWPKKGLIWYHRTSVFSHVTLITVQNGIRQSACKVLRLSEESYEKRCLPNMAVGVKMIRKGEQHVETLNACSEAM